MAQDFIGSEKYQKLIEKKWYKEGYLVNTSGDTLQGLIRFRSNSSGELSSFWFFNTDGKKIYREPSDVQSIKCGELIYYSKEGSMYLLIHKGDSFDLVKNVTVSGAIQVLTEFGLGYIGVSTDTTPMAMLLSDLIPHSTMLHLVDNNSGEYLLMRKKDFRKNYMDIFSSCKSLIAKIDGGEYAFSNLNTIVAEYDSCE